MVALDMVSKSGSVDDNDIDLLGTPASKYKIPEGAPVLPALSTRMGVELVVKDDGNAMVLYDKKLGETVHWVDYDMDLDQLTFITWQGKIFGLGMKVQPAFRKYLKQARGMYMIYMEDAKKPKLVDYLPLVVRRIGL